ncbi:3'(2'),5'-bisphosphate nucleotidase [Roseibium denhamense]|uniref:3'(2'),5'-bisphosphate nucleotidase CysQ n=1 Tax=Roseibium denhamense TaxID=76305 RepID=A0ABY1PQ68_9HYPH|nr:3'(2'),5'-bisphosphate nucleotidase CysQ [Roseibium denhamense]MTI04118.1 3'(2'),5'-bisphosphate nucleotidase [Roseibium denhamense]SMP37349.1 3'(2'),5'-bisphosphate nucleotidase [Roseibium denhamense]
MADGLESEFLTEAQVKALNELAVEAGKVIMTIYAEPFEALDKSDGSPVTKADGAAEAIILQGLSNLFPGIPVVAEEAVEAGDLPSAGDRYFLVDPLDGTKEFLKKNGEFTVNIALIENGVPVFGVVAAPALDEVFWGGCWATGGEARQQAFKGTISGPEITTVTPISVRAAPAAGLSVLASRSHLSEETAALIDQLNVAERLSVGSSLKLCWVAAGRADLYPRLAPTMQWDIAAGDAVVRAAGGSVVYADTGKDFVYKIPENPTKDDLRNPYFIAVSDKVLLPDPVPAM